MFNKFGDSVAQIAQRTKTLAVEALEAIDAPEKLEASSQQAPTLVTRRASAPPDAGVSSFSPSNSDDRLLLSRLIEAVNGSCDPSNLREEVSMILTQIDLVREQAFSSNILSMEQKEAASAGSLLVFLDSLLEHQAASTLLDALEHEQGEHEKTRQKFSLELEKMRRELNERNETKSGQIEDLNLQISQLTSQNETMQQALSHSNMENRKLRQMVDQLIVEKATLQEESDNADKVDGRIIRSAFISLCLNMNDQSVRDGILRVMSEMLNLSPEEKQRCVSNIDTTTTQQNQVLAKAFLEFLEEEVGSSSTSQPN
jgi:hypothetical protein